MWVKGLGPWRIAVLCRPPHRKVCDHIRTRIVHWPELFGQRLMLQVSPHGPGRVEEAPGTLGMKAALTVGSILIALR